MNCNVRLSRLVVPVIVLAAVLAVGQRAEAQVKPFRIAGAGVAPYGVPLPGQDPRPHWIVGDATQIGLHVGYGSVRTDTAVPDLANGRFTGEFGSGDPFAFIGKKGTLVCYYGRTDKGAQQPGTFELTILDVLPDGNLVVEAMWIAEFVVQPELCTGKFAGTTGSWIMYAWSKPFVLGSDAPLQYGWVGAGQLNFAK